jgi:hypothetical protein
MESKSGIHFYQTLRGPTIFDVGPEQVDRLLRHLAGNGINGVTVHEQTLPQDPTRRTLKLPEWVNEDHLQAALDAYSVPT